MGQPSVRHRQMDSACAGQLLLFSQQAMHSPKATVCCMSRHCLPIQMSRAGELRKWQMIGQSLHLKSLTGFRGSQRSPGHRVWNVLSTW